MSYEQSRLYRTLVRAEPTPVDVPECVRAIEQTVLRKVAAKVAALRKRKFHDIVQRFSASLYSYSAISQIASVKAALGLARQHKCPSTVLSDIWSECTHEAPSDVTVLAGTYAEAVSCDLLWRDVFPWNPNVPGITAAEWKASAKQLYTAMTGMHIYGRPVSWSRSESWSQFSEGDVARWPDTSHSPLSLTCRVAALSVPVYVDEKKMVGLLNGWLDSYKADKLEQQIDRSAQHITADQLKLLRWFDRTGKSELYPKDLSSAQIGRTPWVDSLVKRLGGKPITRQAVLQHPLEEEDNLSSLVPFIKTQLRTWSGPQRLFYSANLKNEVFALYVPADLVEQSLLHWLGYEDDEYEGHFTKTGMYTLGWVRFTRLPSGGCWIDEVQTDLTKSHPEAEFEMGRLLGFILVQFCQWAHKNSLSPIWMPSYAAKTTLYPSTDPPVSAYEEAPKSARFNRTDSTKGPPELRTIIDAEDLEPTTTWSPLHPGGETSVETTPPMRLWVHAGVRR